MLPKRNSDVIDFSREENWTTKCIGILVNLFPINLIFLPLSDTISLDLFLFDF